MASRERSGTCTPNHSLFSLSNFVCFQSRTVPSFSGRNHMLVAAAFEDEAMNGGLVRGVQMNSW
jgi:hypothetical protein